MLDPKLIQDMMQQIQHILPEGLKDTKADLSKQVTHILQNTFAKMNLVTREEFDAQKEVLRRLYAKVEALEAKLDEQQQN